MGKIIDISKWQGKINFSKAAPELDLAILRASVGLSKDERFDEYADALTQYGVPYGAYHYTYLTNEIRAQQEAENFYESAHKKNPAFWVIDLEDSEIIKYWNQGEGYRNQIKKAIKKFVETLRKKGAERIVLYTWEWWGKLLPDKEYNWAWRWYANYGKNNGTPTSTVKGCQLHQYTSTGKVSGINTNVDLNQLNEGATLELLLGYSIKQDSIDKNDDKLIVRIVEPKSWNVRKGPGTQYESLGFAQVGEEFEYVATAVNGWIALEYSNKTIGWVSSSAAKVVNI